MINQSITIKYSRDGNKSILLWEFLLPVLIIFRFIFQNGNLNLLYLFSATYFFIYLLGKNDFRNYVIIILIFAFFISILQFYFSPLFVSWTKIFVVIIKLLLCLSIFYFSKEKINPETGLKMSKIILNYYVAITFLAFVFRGNKLLWANDLVNKYIGTRLKLFTLEPSQLGFVVSFCLLFILVHVVENGICKSDIVELLIAIIIFAFSLPMNAIISLVVGIIVYLFQKTLQAIKHTKTNPTVFIISLFILLSIVLILSTSNGISNRVNDVFNMSDSSFQSRFMVPIQYLPILLKESNFLGVGLGNMSSSKVLGLIPFIFSNSTLAFIAEGGFFAIVFFLIFQTKAYMKSYKSSYSFYKLPIFWYLFVFQIAGGYFTDPIIWMLYGVIFSSDSSCENKKYVD